MYEVYVYLNPNKPGKYSYNEICFTLQPIYIGKGNIKNKRKFCHLIQCTNILLKRKLAKMRRNNSDPIIQTLQIFENETDALSFEIKLIQDIGRINLKTGTLCNFTNGGEGSSGYNITESHLYKKRLLKLKYWSTKSLEERRNILKNFIHQSPESIQKRVNNQKNTKNKWSDEYRNQLEKNRFKKWCKKYYNRTEEQKKTTSTKCSVAGKKQRGSKIFYILEDVDTNTKISLGQYDWLRQYHIDSTLLKAREKGICTKLIISSKTKQKFKYIEKVVFQDRKFPDQVLPVVTVSV